MALEQNRADFMNVGGFSDSVFETVALFVEGRLDARQRVGEIDKVALDAQ